VTARDADYVLTRQWVEVGERIILPPGFVVAKAESDDVTERLLLWVLVPEISSGESDG
jgi:hypothetical protein